ncbi:ornithine carbamoyltransferase [Candidatus Phycosocius bacilliformis]|uniref:Ornithine carbamoyltransferase n=1 Tax=Candidatus Phycosocius bacilliformis TaxID=1445552 RepID=A0A2P2EBZ2_9PROT|nr:ornithine carbamoyltransferase [Candidatus Phycosocius bacilliformis]GBF58561.1 ornithine carbamoyltransferase [Candidatus Phycosocius bacilliformis]
MRHFLDIDDLAPEDVRAILDEAHARKAARQGWPKGRVDRDAPLSGHVLAAIFEKNSTRTRVSFDAAMRQLGGATLTMDAATSQLGRGESIADTARVLSRMVDVIALRAHSHQSLVELAHYASVPVINALTDFSHPCQILADLMTLEEAGIMLKGARIAWSGDGNNVLTSFIHAAGKLGFEVAAACPAGFQPNPAVVDKGRAAGAVVHLYDDPAQAVAGADCVVTDTWVSMGDTNVGERMQALGPYQVNEDLMAKANSGAIFLHCLPAHRGEEVTDAVMDGPQSRIFDEAENRIHAQKAVLTWCLGQGTHA